MFCRYSTSLVSNSSNEISRFVNGLSDLVRDECGTTMIYNAMNLDRLMVYTQCFEESRLNKLQGT